jgi:hypothetical protein
VRASDQATVTPEPATPHGHEQAALWRLVDDADAAMYRAKRRAGTKVATAGVPRARSPRAEETSP